MPKRDHGDDNERAHVGLGQQQHADDAHRDRHRHDRVEKFSCTSILRTM